MCRVKLVCFCVCLWTDVSTKSPITIPDINTDIEVTTEEPEVIQQSTEIGIIYDMRNICGQHLYKLKFSVLDLLGDNSTNIHVLDKWKFYPPIRLLSICLTNIELSWYPGHTQSFSQNAKECYFRI